MGASFLWLLFAVKYGRILSIGGGFLISTIADWTGIISFIMTIALLIRSESMRKELESQRQDYVKEQKAIKERLIALRANVIDDGLLITKVVSDIRTQLFTFQQKFKHLLNWEDKKHLKKTLAILSKDTKEIDPKELCIELDYFVARFERKERKQ